MEITQPTTGNPNREYKIHLLLLLCKVEFFFFSIVGVCDFFGGVWGGGGWGVWKGELYYVRLETYHPFKLTT